MTSPHSASTDDLPALHRSVEDGTLELLYQPEVELDSGALVAMEGLLRWHHGDLGVLAPPAFLDLAERSGDIGPIGMWVLSEGAREARRWQSLPGPQRRLWLNVSLTQVTSPTLALAVSHAIGENGLAPGALGLEVSEATVLHLGDQAMPHLQALRDAGVAIAVDDFSTWYATLGVIADLPVDVVKLGQRYVRGIGEDVTGDDEKLDAMVSTIVDQAHDHGMLVVAEGVETWAEAARLTELGCDRAHGWLFASPQRADRARWLLSRGAGWRGGMVTPQTRARPFVPTPRGH
ncbi:MAG TPA: EAL domain-containing protein [Mycobacteriales bacterium]|nr:EAL domain-containing protein [Mycobacteriales bacterium]